jgi:general secretion pathway protein H
MRTAGFTLLELLIVLVLLALIAGAGGAFIAKGYGRTEVRTAVRDVASALRRSRAEAITRNADWTLTVHVGQPAYRIAGQDWRPLPRQFPVTLVTAETERIAANQGNIRFFADGSSTGGEIAFSDEQTKYHVQVDWLTGRISSFEVPLR